jgi:Protein of unknown function (DUF3891)
MLLREDGDSVVVIGQPAHAWLSGQLARAWGNERLGDVVPREEVCLGAEQHDVGMAAWDLSPTLNPETGRPHSFMEMPIATHLELWTDAPARLLAQSRYAALLVSMHGVALYERRNLDKLSPDDADAVRAYLAGQRAFQEELIASLGADPAAVRRNQRLVWTWDFLSLALCLDWAPTEIGGVPSADEPLTLRLRDDTIDPWPFAAEQVALQTEGRRLEGRFDDEAAMREALSRAPWQTLRFELSARPPSRAG